MIQKFKDYYDSNKLFSHGSKLPLNKICFRKKIQRSKL